ncbi:hypothetical protein V1477_004810 [Vespula maculifrons]|uniref:Uncharacterized protein n=1 Tax=Vespula maculifrons TaxID=7453 RepID=A0ABD2CNY0_VESMC
MFPLRAIRKRIGNDRDKSEHFMQRRHSSIDLSTTKSHSSSLPTRSEKKSSVELHLRANPDKTLRPCGKQK